MELSTTTKVCSFIYYSHYTISGKSCMIHTSSNVCTQRIMFVIMREPEYERR